MQGAGIAALYGVLERIVGLFELVPPGPGGRLAVLAGAPVEDGAAPDGLLVPVIAGCGTSVEVSAEFVAAWRSVVGERVAIPEPVDEQRAFDTAIAVLTGRRGRPRWRRRAAGFSQDQAFALAEGWLSSAQ